MAQKSPASPGIVCAGGPFLPHKGALQAAIRMPPNGPRWGKRDRKRRQTHRRRSGGTPCRGTNQAGGPPFAGGRENPTLSRPKGARPACAATAYTDGDGGAGPTGLYGWPPPKKAGAGNGRGEAKPPAKRGAADGGAGNYGRPSFCMAAKRRNRRTGPPFYPPPLSTVLAAIRMRPK